MINSLNSSLVEDESAPIQLSIDKTSRNIIN